MHEKSIAAPDLLGLAAAAGLEKATIHLRRLEPRPLQWAADDGHWQYPASLIKLPLAVAAAAAIEAGRLTWTSLVSLDERNMTPNDAPSPLQPGYVSTVDELVTLMLQRSDNVATNQLFDLLDRRRASEDLHRLGFSETFFRRKLSGALPLIDDPEANGRNSFPAAEAAALLTALTQDGVPGAARLREILAVSWWNVKLSRGLADGDRFAHKTGDTDEVSHDAGILTLTDASRWVLVVYTELPSSDENDARFGAFMRTLRPCLLAA